MHTCSDKGVRESENAPDRNAVCRTLNVLMRIKIPQAQCETATPQIKEGESLRIEFPYRLKTC